MFQKTKLLLLFDLWVWILWILLEILGTDDIETKFYVALKNYSYLDEIEDIYT